MTIRGAKTLHGQYRPEYLPPPAQGVKYLNDPAGRARRRHPGDKLRRKAFERKAI